MNEKDMFILDDRPDDDPRVIARREKELKELPPEKREEIDKRVAKMVSRIKEKRAREKIVRQSEYGRNENDVLN